MLPLQRILFSLIIFAAITTFQVAFGESINHATVAAGGYDVVSYHTKEGPVQGTGWHTSKYEGVAYLFASKKNKKLFDNDPGKYAPAYGGYCAYGVAVGKKFYIDPLSWHIENGTLYLNLDKKIQKKWLKDVSGYIEKADTNWKKIKDIPAKEL